MSQIYVSEPPTLGKVVLETSVGDIEIELWAKETPTTCRNFVQLCLEKYYDGLIFHRLVKDFMVQTGDPTGTGHGGESVFGAPFSDEFHSRLRFSHRGLVGMANTGPNTNASQFFLTFNACDWLNKMNTVFGKVTGSSIFNLLKMNELEVDENERPLFPPRITGAVVVNNPFPDIVARELKKPSVADEARVKVVKKNVALLSFDEESDEEEQPQSMMNVRIRSSHDVLDDPKLSRATDSTVGKLKRSLNVRPRRHEESKGSDSRSVEAKVVEEQRGMVETVVGERPSSEESTKTVMPEAPTSSSGVAQVSRTVVSEKKRKAPGVSRLSLKRRARVEAPADGDGVESEFMRVPGKEVQRSTVTQQVPGSRPVPVRIRRKRDGEKTLSVLKNFQESVRSSSETDWRHHEVRFVGHESTAQTKNNY